MKVRQAPTPTERHKMISAAKIMFRMAPDDTAAAGVLMGVVNTIFQIWGTEEAKWAAETLEEEFRTVSTFREQHRPADDDEQPDPWNSEVATQILAMEGLLNRRRN